MESTEGENWQGVGARRVRGIRSTQCSSEGGGNVLRGDGITTRPDGTYCRRREDERYTGGGDLLRSRRAALTALLVYARINTS